MNKPTGNGSDHFDLDAFCNRMADLKLLRSFKYMLAKVPGKNPKYDPLAEAEGLELELKKVTEIVAQFNAHERYYPSKVSPEKRAEVAKAAGVSLAYLDELMRQMPQVQAMLTIMARPVKVYDAPGAPRKRGKAKPTGAAKTPPAAPKSPAAPMPPAAEAPAPAAAQPQKAKRKVACAWATPEDRMRWFPVWNRNLVLWEFIADPSE